MQKDIFKKTKEKWKLITGAITGQTPYGYCYYKNHRGYLTKALIKEHQCTAKQCRYFRKNDDHPHWKRKEQIKALQKAKKNGESTYSYNGKIYLVSEKVIL